MRLAIIGTGNMGQAILKGIIRQQKATPADIKIFDTDFHKSAVLAAELGVSTAQSAMEAIEQAEVIILATKPTVCESALAPLRAAFSNKQILVSIAAGLTLANLRRFAGPMPVLARVMPNMPALAGCGVSALALEQPNQENEQILCDIFAGIGNVHVVEESLFDAVTALSGSGPAYMMLILEALADGAVEMGLPRQLALTMAAQTMAGSARLLLETNSHPGHIKDQVCSPSGTSIAGISALELHGTRAAMMAAVRAAAIQSEQMREQAECDQPLPVFPAKKNNNQIKIEMAANEAHD